MTLPFQWKAVPSDEGYEFRNQKLPEQLIVTVSKTVRRLEVAELRQALQDFVSARVRALTQLSKGNATIEAPEYNYGEREAEARVFGSDAPNNVMIAFVVRATPEKFVIAALTRYTLVDDPPIHVYAGIIFDFLKVKLH